MSGGSLDYVSCKVEDAADTIDGRSRYDRDTPAERRVLRVRRAFARHLRLVAKALHEVEWSMSGDTGFGDDIPSIEAAMGKGAKVLDCEELAAELRQLVYDANRFLRGEEG